VAIDVYIIAAGSSSTGESMNRKDASEKRLVEVITLSELEISGEWGSAGAP
jgi:hypothetical protein